MILLYFSTNEFIEYSDTAPQIATNIIFPFKMEELKNFLSSKGVPVTARDMGGAVVIHEVLGLSVLVSAWAACWAIKPSRHLINSLQLRKRTEWIKAQERMQKSKLINTIKDSKYVSSKTATGLAIAFGESCFLRKLCMPLLVPLKLWLTYEILVMTNKSIIKKENEDLK